MYCVSPPRIWKVTWVPAGMKQPSVVRVSVTGAVKMKESPCAWQGTLSVDTAWTVAACGSVKVQVVGVPGAVALVHVRSAVGACSGTALVMESDTPALSITVKLAL